MQQEDKTVIPERGDVPSPTVSGDKADCINTSKLTFCAAIFDDTAEVTVMLFSEGGGEPREIRMPLERYMAIFRKSCEEN